MPTLSQCPKCGSTNLGIMDGFPCSCGDCDWIGTSERLMEL